MSFFEKYGKEEVAFCFDMIPGTGSSPKSISIEELYQAIKERLQDEQDCKCVEKPEEKTIDKAALTEEGFYGEVGE